MPYVVTDHNNQDFVLLGPIEWKPRYIATIVGDEIGETIPTLTEEDKARVPFDIVPGIRIRECNTTEIRQNDYHDRVHFINGPTWTYNADGTATATWTQTNKDVELIKGNLRTIVAQNRYKKETSGLKITFQGNEVYIDSSRERRNAFQDRAVVMNDTETVSWKFADNLILNVTKAELLNVSSQIYAHVQSCFDWETAKIVEVNNCTTFDELKNLDLRPETENPFVTYDN